MIRGCVRRDDHPRVVWMVEHMLTLYIALAVSALVVLALYEAVTR